RQPRGRMRDPPRMKIDDVCCPKELPYKLKEFQGKWVHTVQLTSEIVTQIQKSAEHRKVGVDLEIPLTRSISSKRQFDNEQEAIDAMEPCINIQRLPDEPMTVSKKSPISANKPDHPACRLETFNLYIEKGQDLWSIVVAIDG
ncbi:uncharacterized protein PV07_12685, partial [Cladophialophora immunda]